jgi:hypothetical protein
MAGIIWLASYPKSGNTWMRAFLANLLAGGAQPVDINQLTRFSYSEARRDLYDRLSDRPVDDLDVDALYQLRQRVHRHIAETTQGHAIVKTHCSLSVIGGVETVTPDVTAGAIYITRNPLDVAVSYRDHFDADMNGVIDAFCSPHHELITDGQQVHQHLGGWAEHVSGWRDAPGLNPLVLKYEDMLRSPTKAFAKVMAYLQIPKDIERLKRAIRFSRFEELQRQETTAGFTERPREGAKFFRGGRAGGWRRTLSSEQVERLLEANRPVMRDLGYLKRDGSPQ